MSLSSEMGFMGSVTSLNDLNRSGSISSNHSNSGRPTRPAPGVPRNHQLHRRGATRRHAPTPPSRFVWWLLCWNPCPRLCSSVSATVAEMFTVLRVICEICYWNYRSLFGLCKFLLGEMQSAKCRVFYYSRF